MKTFILSALLVFSLFSTHPCTTNAQRFPIRRAGPLRRNEFLTPENLIRFNEAQEGLTCPRNICFALDGSSAITEEEYTKMVSFAQVIAAITRTDRAVNFAAGQYGTAARLIARFGRRGILSALLRSRPTLSEIIFITPGLLFCNREIDDGVRPSTVILIGDGEFNFRSGPSSFVEINYSDDSVRRLVAVGVGPGSEERLGESLGRPESVVAAVDEPNAVDAVLRVVEAACA